ncbi:hypothetical protein P7D22_16565 [Lichenihabitans sp. Uapishka_5]|uniref:hypothetical protein n=1 Tax=Lichenihabitans sp. Uapishka_5 TaxID=3037302 RepID=UPI0029E7D8CD|nr:hypothetical protein [Lichenihabitans sp. Uapishka_5]MDX7952782.1 hypothetical protein [Lichenihabitans sp. Uapishka_5]
MDSTNSRAGLMSGIAMAIYGTTPSDLEESGAGRHGIRSRALRHARLRSMMQVDIGESTRRHMANRLTRAALDD